MDLQRLILVPVPFDQLIAKLGDAVVERLLNSGVLQTTGKNNSKWLNHAEAALYIKKSAAALYKLTSDRKIIYRKKGKTNIYKVSDLDMYLETGEIKTAEGVVNDLKFLPKRKYTTAKNK